jgi:cell wall-associated NlpC family hydrolase
MDANRYISIPFAERGRSWEGVDCWGLVCLIYHEQLGIALPSYLDDDYKTTDGPTISCLIGQRKAEGWEPVAPGTEREGDVILMRMVGLPSHVGVVTRPGSMIHALRGVGVCHERYWSPLWAKRIMGIYRYGRA